ncbi:MAG: rRNA maturation RNase YbeY [Fusobacterium sp.]|nr:rRNA maturation RNase YbeY [Fusobacterium sp.]
MEINIDLTHELYNEKFDEFLDKLYTEDYLQNYIKKILEIEKIEGDRPFYMSIFLTNNEIIQGVNRDFREKDSPTDVISFAYHETEDFDIGPYDTLGDIVISLERVEEQAKDYNHSFEREFYYVLTHGVLHILGYDHLEEEDKKLMREREELILNYFGYTRDC